MEDLTDKSPMPWGKFKGEKMANVPASYLLWCYENSTCCINVRKYIQKNKEDLQTESKKCGTTPNYQQLKKH